MKGVDSVESTNMADVIDYLSNETLKRIDEARSNGMKYLVVTLEDTVVNGICSVGIKSKTANTEQEIREVINEFGIDLSDPMVGHKVKIYEVI